MYDIYEKRKNDELEDVNDRFWWLGCIILLFSMFGMLVFIGAIVQWIT